jgi:DNA-binding LacI/PurR family transcriptional regulator
MAKGRNRILGVFTYEPAFPGAQADFFAPFLFGIEEAAQERGYDLLLLTGAPFSHGKRRIFDEQNRLRLADGCLILGREVDRDELARLVGGDYPFVAVGRREPVGERHVPYVGGDYRSATGELVRRALAKGHSRFAYVGPSGGAEATLDRWQGFNTALRGATLANHIPEVGGPAAPLLEAIRRSGATVAFFTELADAVVVEALMRSQNLKVPEDLSIVVLGSHLRPQPSVTQFTCLSVPREDMGRRATHMLCERIEGSSAGGQVLLDCELVEGETLGTNSRG